MRTNFAAFAAAVILGSFAVQGPASATPTGPMPIVSNDGNISPVRMTGDRMLRHRMRHGHRMRSWRGSDPNARNPSRPGYQQQKGQTTGGPRY